jgi:hypothetical protein
MQAREQTLPAQIAKRLWDAAQKRGGAIIIGDVSYDDVMYGKAMGWLTTAGIGHFEATEKLREAATDSDSAP